MRGDIRVISGQIRVLPGANQGNIRVTPGAISGQIRANQGDTRADIRVIPRVILQHMVHTESCLQHHVA